MFSNALITLDRARAFEESLLHKYCVRLYSFYDFVLRFTENQAVLHVRSVLCHREVDFTSPVIFQRADRFRC